MTTEQVAILALTGLALILAVAGLVADHGRRQWAKRCAERTAERDEALARADRMQRRLDEMDRLYVRVLDDRDIADALIADMLPHLKHAGASPGLKRRAADLLGT